MYCEPKEWGFLSGLLDKVVDFAPQSRKVAPVTWVQ